MLKLLRPWWFPIALLALFGVYARPAASGSDSPAPPSAALRAFAGALGDGSLLHATAFTLGSAALGLAIGAALGVTLGITLGLSKRAARLSVVTVEMLRPV